MVFIDPGLAKTKLLKTGTLGSPSQTKMHVRTCQDTRPAATTSDAVQQVLDQQFLGISD